MENWVIIVSVLAVLGLGFIPVMKLVRFVNKNRKDTVDVARAGRLPRGEREEGDPMNEFEKTGILDVKKAEDGGQLE